LRISFTLPWQLQKRGEVPYQDDEHQGNENRFGAILRRRRRVSLVLSGIVVAGYAGLILLMAFASDRLGAPLTPGCAVTVGIFWGFVYALVALAAMGVYVWWRTANGEAEAGQGMGPGADE